MKPGERIRLIKTAAESLSARPKADIQLILDQHGVGIYEWERQNSYQEPESAYEYCVGRLSRAIDDELTAIHEYVTGDDAVPAAEPATERIWGTNRPKDDRSRRTDSGGAGRSPATGPSPSARGDAAASLLPGELRPSPRR